MRPAFAALMVDVVPAADRLRAFAHNYWAVNLGFACAAVLAGLAGLAAEASYLLLFLVDAGTTLIAAVVIATKVAESRPGWPALAAPGDEKRPRGPGDEKRPRDPGLRAVFSDRVFVCYLGLALLLAFVFMQNMSTLPVAVGHDRISPARYGSVIALNGILIVSGQLFVPRLLRGRDRTSVLAVAAAIVGVGFGLTAFADTVPLYAVTVLIWTAGEMLNSPSHSALIADLAPANLRGRYQGAFSLSWSVASAGAPIIGGWVQQHLGDPALWLGCGVIGMIVAVGNLIAGPARERRRAALRSAELDYFWNVAQNAH